MQTMGTRNPIQPRWLSESHRLRKHADYQRVYRESRKQFSASMSFFFSIRNSDPRSIEGARVGLTVGRVLGNAVDRNRIKRRMREIVRRHVALLPMDVDVVLHPRRSVLTIEFARLEQEVARIFLNIQAARKKTSENSAATEKLKVQP